MLQGFCNKYMNKLPCKVIWSVILFESHQMQNNAGAYWNVYATMMYYAVCKMTPSYIPYNHKCQKVNYKE